MRESNVKSERVHFEKKERQAIEAKRVKQKSCEKH